MPGYRIVPIAEEHIDGFRAALDAVAREERYLAMLEAPLPEAVREFVRGNIRRGNPQLVAIEGGTVVGWCDVLPKTLAALQHSGTLGIGAIANARGRGIGSALIEAALEAAERRGLTRVELTVRTDNPRARALYEKFGFVVEGLCSRHMCIRGTYYDSYLMARVR